MLIQDKIYGKVDIEEPILVELIESAPMQRLKNISQHGVPERYLHYKDFYRFEHCIGVMILLRKLGATLEEQIAGLLHDVSHTAFSHLIDWVIQTKDIREAYADSQHQAYLKRTGIDRIIQKYGYNFDRISDPHQFSLLEQESPDLCADRVDYALREFLLNGKEKYTGNSIENFTTFEGKIVCTDYKTALWFAENFLWCQENLWANEECVSRYHWFAKALKYAVEDGTIRLEDFWQDDNFVMEKIKTSTNPNLHTILKILESKSLSQFPVSDEVTYKKFRYVDPLFLQNGILIRLSEHDSAFKNTLEKARENNNKGIQCAKIV